MLTYLCLSPIVSLVNLGVSCQVMITSDRKQHRISLKIRFRSIYLFAHASLNSSTMSAPPPPPQSFPYDHLFKILTIGDAGVGKVCQGAVEHFLCLFWYPFSSGAEGPTVISWTFGHVASLTLGENVYRLFMLHISRVTKVVFHCGQWHRILDVVSLQTSHILLSRIRSSSHSAVINPFAVHR